MKVLGAYVWCLQKVELQKHLRQPIAWLHFQSKAAIISEIWQFTACPTHSVLFFAHRTGWRQPHMVKAVSDIEVIIGRFAADGHVDLDLRKFVYYTSPSRPKEIDLSRLGFFVTTPEAEGQLEVDLERVQSWHNSQTLCLQQPVPVL